MSMRSISPRTLHGALVAMESGKSPRVVSFQYNPATMKRTLHPKMMGGEEQDRSEEVRFIGAPVQTISIDIHLDSTDELEHGDTLAMEEGIYPKLALLELLVYPASQEILKKQRLLKSGVIEIIPMEAPTLLFIWGKNRVLPVRINDYQISEDTYDTSLNPIRATVSLSMRVLNYSDLNSENKEYDQFMAYQKTMETLAQRASDGPANRFSANSEIKSLF